MLTQEKIDAAIAEYGTDAVYQAMEVAEMADPDGAWSMFEDLGQFELAEVVEFLYFD